ncbi:MAG: penicillin-binding protein 1B [bacterium]
MKLFGYLLVFLMVAGGFSLLVLDYQVRSKFAGSKWELPAHVYSRPLEIYAGLNLDQSDLEWELRALGYRKRPAVAQVGEYSVARNRIEIYKRRFDFWDGEEPAERISLTFSSDGVQRLQTARGGTLPLTRLEPLMIGGIYPTLSEDREVVRLNAIPHYLSLGLIAVEDRGFYQHHGISVRGISRAMMANIKQRRVAQGGSTITQQLVKNFYLSHEQTLTRKGIEAVMAVLLELHAEKDEILEAYLNEVYMGQAGKRAIHGFGMASRHYFNQPLGELQLHQAALLIGMVKGASYYNPLKHPQRARERRNLVLDQMVAEEVITADEGERAKRKPLDLQQGSIRVGRFPDYLDLVKRQLQSHYDEQDLQSEGLRIFTPFDPRVQTKLEQAISSEVSRIEADYRLKQGGIEAASVVLRVGTGEIVALTGGREGDFSGFNRALDAKRPIGSTVKPAVTLAALQQPGRYTLSTLVDDGPVEIKLDTGKTWSPQNYDRESHGRVPVYDVLGQSYNQATARLGMEAGLQNVADVLHGLGYQGDLPLFPAMLLGSVDMSAMEVAEVYNTIAANGFYSPLRAIQSVFDTDQTPLRRYNYQTEQRFSAQSMHLLHYAMQVVMREGTGKSAYNRIPKDVVLLGKTGTTNDKRDSWFTGFGGNYLAVVWLGRDDNGKMPISGGTGALAVWSELMKNINVTAYPFLKPDGVEYHWVEPADQRLSSKGCPGARYVPFVEGSEPRKRSRCYRGGNQVIDWLRDALGF